MDNLQRIKDKLQELVAKSAQIQEEKEENLNHSDGFGMDWSGFNNCLKELIPFVDSLPEEPVSEDLEEAAYNYVMDNFGNSKEPLYKFYQRCFKAGAEWQKEQMMKHVFVCDIGKAEKDGKPILRGNFAYYDAGDKVKIIIVKDE